MNKQNKPIYSLFQTSNNDFYMFDTYLNKIRMIPPKCFEYLRGLKAGREDFYESANKIDDSEFKEFFQASLKQGYFQKYYIEKLEHPMTEFLDDILDSNIESINLQVTQNCNLRCEYCPYTGNYYNNRKHANRSMSFELAKRGIDYLYDHSRDCNVINVSFYGGEPLLEFELIKKCIQYTKTLFETKEVVFSLTTNGILLTDEIMAFFSENNVLLTVSLDGPRSIHDKFRVFANGKGSFEIIYKNLCYFKSKYTEYYNRNVMFNAVSAQDEGVIEIDNFFSEDSLFEKCEVATTFYSTNYVVNEPKYNAGIDRFVEHMEFEKYKCFLYMMKRVNVVPTRMQLNSFGVIKKTENELRSFTGIPKVFHPAGPCVPGRKKLFMNVDGNFFPCERIDETSSCSIIGNINEGLSLEKCKRLLNIGKITEEKCRNCWAITQCKFCFVQADNGGELCSKCRLDKCNDLYGSIIDIFKDICILKKVGYQFEEEDA